MSGEIRNIPEPLNHKLRTFQPPAKLVLLTIIRVIKKNVSIYACLPYTFVEPTRKRNKKFAKYLAQRAMIMSYVSAGTGVTADIDSYIIHTPYCIGTAIKVKPTRLRSQEEPKPLPKKKTSKWQEKGENNVEKTSFSAFMSYLVTLLARYMNMFRCRHVISHTKHQAGRLGDRISLELYPATVIKLTTSVSQYSGCKTPRVFSRVSECEQ